MLRMTAAALVLLSLISGCTASPSSPAPSTQSLAVTVNDGGDPARAWVAKADAPTRPGWSDDWGPWVAAAQATPLSALTILLTVQGKVSAVRVKVVARRPPVAGTQYVVVGADPVTSERLEFDLDGSPAARPVSSEPDTIAVTVQTQQCDCDWVIELDWPGGTRTVDNDGKPFRVSASIATVGRCVTYPDRVEKCEDF
ncbi:MAG TPA: hypothetical protein VFC19_04715 [Candidatus Limnocylindrales bacterium]|nr:hypothetical protein [Candidatus Limnocylindrales bacterium]